MINLWYILPKYPFEKIHISSPHFSLGGQIKMKNLCVEIITLSHTLVVFAPNPHYIIFGRVMCNSTSIGVNEERNIPVSVMILVYVYRIATQQDYGVLPNNTNIILFPAMYERWVSKCTSTNYLHQEINSSLPEIPSHASSLIQNIHHFWDLSMEHGLPTVSKITFSCHQESVPTCHIPIVKDAS